jgi:hypothetical protein
MVYTAIIHGATAMDYFVLDNDIARTAGGLYGISPEPKEFYTKGPGVTADAARLKKIKELWDTASGINKEIKDLIPWLLSPTSTANYNVYIRGESKTQTPIRTILKLWKNEYVLLAVNIDNATIDTRFEFESRLKVKTIKAMYEKRKDLKPRNSIMEDQFKPFEVHIYKFKSK